MVSKVRGNFETFSGAITVDENGVPSVTAEIDVASINTGNEGRDGHIRSADFFEVESTRPRRSPRPRSRLTAMTTWSTVTSASTA